MKTFKKDQRWRRRASIEGCRHEAEEVVQKTMEDYAEED